MGDGRVGRQSPVGKRIRSKDYLHESVAIVGKVGYLLGNMNGKTWEIRFDEVFSIVVQIIITPWSMRCVEKLGLLLGNISAICNFQKRMGGICADGHI
jgi:hypothetical protein